MQFLLCFVREVALRAPTFLTPSGLYHLRAVALRRSVPLRSTGLSSCHPETPHNILLCQSRQVSRGSVHGRVFPAPASPLFVCCPEGTRFLTLRFTTGFAISALPRFVVAASPQSLGTLRIALRYSREPPAALLFVAPPQRLARCVGTGSLAAEPLRSPLVEVR